MAQERGFPFPDQIAQGFGALLAWRVRKDRDVEKAVVEQRVGTEDMSTAGLAPVADCEDE